MDLDIEKIHNILIEANFPSSINDLKNPTNEFVVNLFNTFLRRFHIDVSVIDQPTIEQHEIMSYCDESDIIGLINLYVVMVQICNRIFLKDLCITDITNPGSKKIRKQAKLLVNFVLYATTKESDIKDQLDEIQKKTKVLQDMLDKTDEVEKAINERELYKTKQLSLKDKYTANIQELQSKLEKNNKHFELTAKLAAAEENKRKAMELRKTYKAQASKLDKTITQLQSEIVESPEKYKMRLTELEKQQSAKFEKRKEMQETFQDKKLRIEQGTNILNLVEKQLEKFGEVQEMHRQLKQLNIQEENVKKQTDILRSDISESEKKLKTQIEQHKEIEVDELHAQYEERLTPLRNLNTRLLSEKKICKEKMEEVKLQYSEEYLRMENMQSAIRKVEEETAMLIKNYQELYDNEILTEKALCETWAYE